MLAIGNPLGVGLSITGGIVSVRNRDIMETLYDDYMKQARPGLEWRVLQIAP